MTKRRVRAPDYLQPATAKWWRSVHDDYVLEPHHVRLLTLAAESWDRCQAARAVLDAEGLTYLDRFKAPRARPEVAIERDSRLAFARFLRELDLDVDPDNPPTWRNLYADSWPLAVALQRELLAAGAKMPTKAEKHDETS